MADINTGARSARGASVVGEQPPSEAPHGGNRLPDAAAEPSDDELIALVELLFFAYRDFTGEADAVLHELGFGRAHHRVLHFVNRRPGLRVADLLDILRITKQSLARVLKQLVDRGFVVQAAGPSDRRERRLNLTTEGKALAAKLAALQVDRIGRALSEAGAAREHRVRNFLFAMIGPEQRASIADAIAASSGIERAGGSDRQPSRTPGGRRPRGGSRP